MKVALVHDFLREYGGAERVLEAMHEMWPEAPLYTSFVDWSAFAKAPAGKVELFKSWDIRTSWVQRYWFIKKFISPLRFLAPWIWGSFDLSGYDVVVSSSGWFMCRGAVQKRQETRDKRQEKPLHICYIHHPPRNLYGYATGSDLQKYWIVRVYAAIVNFFLRHYDWKTAQAVDYFVANSKETARRVEKFYRREATVIYPPIESTNHLINKSSNQQKNTQRRYYLSVGRLTYSKRVDLAIGACNTLKLPFKIVGAGKEEEYLRSLAGPTIQFVGSVSDGELGKLYAGAKALIFCALDEDFGMVPVEAMAYGTPVIALAQGGVVETVVDPSTGSGQVGQATGVLFREPTVESLMGALGRFDPAKRDPASQEKSGGPSFAPPGGASAGKWEENCRKQAEKFGKERFKKELLAFVKHPEV